MHCTVESLVGVHGFDMSNLGFEHLMAFIWKYMNLRYHEVARTIIISLRCLSVSHVLGEMCFV